jgi:hypothetical protein
VVVRNVYVDRTIVERNTVVRDSRVAYSGGPGGIHHEPNNEERNYMHESHMAPTSVQQAHFQAARADHSNYFNANHGQPQRAAVARPMSSPGFSAHGNAGAQNRAGGYNANPGARGQYRPAPQPQQGYRAQPQQGYRGQQQPQYRAPENRPQQQAQPQYRPQPQENRQQQRPEQQRPEQQRPESHPQSRPESRPQHEPKH